MPAKILAKRLLFARVNSAFNMRGVFASPNIIPVFAFEVVLPKKLPNLFPLVFGKLLG